MKTTLVKEKDVQRKWFVVDANGKPLGRLAVKLANLLRGKTKATFAHHIDQGDFVIVVNAAKVKLTGAKEDQKIYKHYSGFASGLKESPARMIRAKNPTRMITQAVKGMMPKNHQTRTMLTRLRVFAGAEHTHAAQKPEALDL